MKSANPLHGRDDQTGTCVTRRGEHDQSAAGDVPPRSSIKRPNSVPFFRRDWFFTLPILTSPTTVAGSYHNADSLQLLCADARVTEVGANTTAFASANLPLFVYNGNQSIASDVGFSGDASAMIQSLSFRSPTSNAFRTRFRNPKPTR